MILGWVIGMLVVGIIALGVFVFAMRSREAGVQPSPPMSAEPDPPRRTEGAEPDERVRQSFPVRSAPVLLPSARPEPAPGRTAAPRSAAAWQGIAGIAGGLLLLLLAGFASGLLLGLHAEPPGRPRPVAAARDDLTPAEEELAPGQLRVFRSERPVTSAALSPDGQRLALLDAEGAVRVWDTATRKERFCIPPVSGASYLHFSPDGRWLVIGGSKQRRVAAHDAASGALTRSFDTESASAGAAFMPDGRKLAVLCGETTIRFWDVTTGESYDFLKPTPDERVRRTILSVQISRDGRRLLTSGASEFQRWGALWDARTGERLVHFGELHGLENIGQPLLSANGRHMALLLAGPFEASGVVPLWDLVERTKMPPVGGPVAVAGAAFAPDGRTLAVGFQDGTMTIWETGEEPHQLARFKPMRFGDNLADPEEEPLVEGDPQEPRRPPGGTRGVWFSTDGRVLATGFRSGVRLWDVATLIGRKLDVPPLPSSEPAPVPPLAIRAADVRELRTLKTGERPLGGMAVSANGRTLATATKPRPPGQGAGKVTFWELETGNEIESLPGEAPVRYSADGKHLVYAERRGGGVGPKRCSARTRRPPTPFFPEQRGTVGMDFAISSDSRLLLSAYGDTLGATALAKDEWAGTHQLSHHPLHALAFAPEGRSFAAARKDGTDVLLFRGTDGTPRLTCSGHTGAVTALAYAPDGRLLASASRDATIRLWDPASGRALGSLTGLKGPVGGVAFSPDGRALASIGPDGVRLWDVAQRKETLQLPFPTEDHTDLHIQFARGGQLLVAGGDGNVRVWDVARLQIGGK